MAQLAFGFLLQNLREGRKLSLRELGLLAGVDHAYIYRLETGDKEAPSEDVLSRLIRALKADKREAEMLRYLANHRETAAGLVAHALNDASITFEEFTAAAGVVHRGTGRPEYGTLIARIRRILADEGRDG